MYINNGYSFQDPVSPHNGESSPCENGNDTRIKREPRPPSRSGSSSNSSTPLSKPKEHLVRTRKLKTNYHRDYNSVINNSFLK